MPAAVPPGLNLSREASLEENTRRWSQIKNQADLVNEYRFSTIQSKSRRGHIYNSHKALFSSENDVDRVIDEVRQQAEVIYYRWHNDSDTLIFEKGGIFVAVGPKEPTTCYKPGWVVYQFIAPLWVLVHDSNNPGQQSP